MNTVRTVNLSKGERILRFGVGMALVTSVLSMSGALGWFALLPLLAIYPSLTALTGYDPVVAVMDDTLSEWSGGDSVPA